MKIHTFRAAVGFLILFLSGILLLTTSGLVSWELWFFVWQFWPMLFVLFGMAFLMRRWHIKFLIGIPIFLLFFAITSYGLWATWENKYFNTENFAEINGKNITETKISNEIPRKTEKADVRIIFGASKIKLGSLADAENNLLYSGKHISNSFSLNERLEVVGDDAKLTLKTPISKKPFNSKSVNELNIDFSKVPKYSFDISTGVSSLDLDFQNLKVSNLDLDAGASDIKVKFGNSTSCDVRVKAAASVIKLYIPKDIGVRVTSKSALTSNNFENFGLMKTKKAWESKDWSKQKNKLNIDLESGASKIELIQ